MNEVGPPRSPLSRAAPVLAVGLALVLAGGFAVGIFVGRKPLPDASPAADQVLPPAAPTPTPTPAPSSVTVPVTPPVAAPVSPPPPPPPPAPVVSPPPPPPPPPAPVAKPVPPPAKPVPAAEPVRKPPHEAPPSRKTAPPAHAKPAPESTAHRHKPESAHALPRPVEGGRWIVQLGAFQSDDHAKLLVDTLAYHGHPARIAGGHDHSGHDWYFVQTPGYATRREAESVARTLQRDQHLPTYVFEAHRPPGG